MGSSPWCETLGDPFPSHLVFLSSLPSRLKKADRVSDASPTVYSKTLNSTLEALAKSPLGVALARGLNER